MNRRKLEGRLTPEQCRRLTTAWIEADNQGFPLDVLISVRPCTKHDPESLDYAQEVEKYWRWLGQLTRRKVGSFYAVLVRETLDRDKSECANFHVLVHAGANLPSIKRAHARRYPREKEVHVRRADQMQRLSKSGKWESAINYITKEREPKAAFNQMLGKHDKHFRPGLPVLGKRFRMTANLRAATVAKIVIRNPLVTPAARNENRKATAFRRA